MDVWKLTEKYKETERKLDFLINRIAEIETYLNQMLEGMNAALHDQKDKPQSVRVKRSTAKKSKAN